MGSLSFSHVLTLDPLLASWWMAEQNFGRLIYSFLLSLISWVVCVAACCSSGGATHRCRKNKILNRTSSGLTHHDNFTSLPSLSRLAGYVEALASRLGMQIPDLSPKQADMWQTRVSSHSVCISITIRSKSQLSLSKLSLMCVKSDALQNLQHEHDEFDRNHG